MPEIKELHIAHICASYKPAYIYGGPVISVSTLCENLAENSCNVSVLTTNANGKGNLNYQDGEEAELELVNVKYFKRLTKDHSHFTPSLYRFLYKNINRYSVIHIHAWWNLVSIGAAMVCILKKKRFILSPRGTLSGYSFYNRTSLPKRIFHFVIGKRLLGKAIFQVSSNKETEDVLKLLPHAKTYCIPNFVELKAASGFKRRYEEHSSLRILFFSRIEEKKGVEFLLKAVKGLAFPFIVDIYGEGEENYLLHLKKLITSDLENKIKFKGAVYGKEKFSILANYDILVLPSYDENFANVVLESLAVGTPLLLTKKVGLSDYVIEKKLGWLCTQDPKDIAETLGQINTAIYERTSIRKNGPGIIENDFSPRSLIKKYSDFYEKISDFQN